uniref:Uncharacterized protein TCIL3000_11_13130 n=1 Tax=Trypanosoma congolense (strain IL3000) TaxID=1068625 RepID=G0V2E2_TRYCI|nr:unnamed protein product [Trypanosoma congolense IL3000]
MYTYHLCPFPFPSTYSLARSLSLTTSFSPRGFDVIICTTPVLTIPNVEYIQYQQQVLGQPIFSPNRVLHRLLFFFFRLLPPLLIGPSLFIPFVVTLQKSVERATVRLRLSSSLHCDCSDKFSHSGGNVAIKGGRLRENDRNCEVACTIMK